MKIEKRRVVVTGGAGFIGSHLVDRLLQAENSVLVIDDFSSGSPENLAEHRGDRNLCLENADVRDEPAMRDLFSQAEFVFHLATRNVRRSLTHPTEVHDVNTNGTLTVLKAAAQSGVQRLLYCSSSEVNGTADVVPMTEDYRFRPETIYGASKLAGEYYANVFHRSGWLETVVARPHNNYGPREHYAGNKGEVIPRFILWGLAGQPLRVYGSGQQTRDFTYVVETADYLVQLLECDAALGQVVNVCRGEEVSIAELAELIRELTGGKSEIQHLTARPSDVLRLIGDASRLKSLLGSSPHVGIEAGLARTSDWFKSHVPLQGTTLGLLPMNSWESEPGEPWIEQAREWKMRRTA
jgi:UDP-glucose 4-epimerase